MRGARLRVDRVRRDVLDNLLALHLEHLATLLRRQLDLAPLDDLLCDRERLRGPEELRHLLLGRLGPFVGVLEDLINRELAEEVHVLAVPNLLDSLGLHEDLKLLARLLDAGDHIFLENIVPTIRSELFGHDVA